MKTLKVEAVYLMAYETFEDVRVRLRMSWMSDPVEEQIFP
jgi:hypothetical protein